MKPSSKPLFIPLKTGYYDGFKSRFKTHEIRLCSMRWNRDTCYPGRKVVLSKGYGKHERMTGEIVSVDVFPALDLPSYEYADFVECYGEARGEEDVIYIGIKIDA